jgi:dihydrofolate reductase
MFFKLIVACDSKGGIGLNGSIPWKITDDIKHFKELTSKVPEDPYFDYINMVVMGRKTWDSLPEKFKPLPGRLNIILSNKDQNEISNTEHELVRVISDFEQINEFNNNNNNVNGKQQKIHDIFVIGGSSIYELALSSPYCRTIYLTEIYLEDKFWL